MKPVMFTHETQGHTLKVYCGLDASLATDFLNDTSLNVFSDDVEIIGVWATHWPSVGWSPDYKGEGIRDLLNDDFIMELEALGLEYIEEWFRTERAANHADKARDDFKASRGG